ncbi:MAG: hypothetical protein ABH878_01770 [bacterium]
MHFLDAFNYWSLLHCIGSCVMTITIGTVNVNVSPAASGLMVMGLGTSWEVVADETLRWNDIRGGDYYDLIWDFAGCAVGVLVLSSARQYRANYTDLDFDPSGYVHSNDSWSGSSKIPIVANADHSGSLNPGHLFAVEYDSLGAVPQSLHNYLIRGNAPPSAHSYP